MKTVTIYHIDGVSKAKTSKAILIQRNDGGTEAWIPLSCVSVKFTGPNYKVRVSVPDWLFSKISWKQPTPFQKKVQQVMAGKPPEPVAATQKKNPYVGCDVGNMLEERMVLEEKLSHEEYEYGMYQDSDDEPTLAEMAKSIDLLKKQLLWIDEALVIAQQ